MKIAHIIGIGSMEHGGPVVSLRNYATEQSARGHFVQVYMLDGYPGTSRVMPLPNPIRHTIENVDWPYKIGRSVALKRKIRDSTPSDVYHLHGIWLRAMYYGFCKARQEGRPVMIEINGAMDPLELRNKYLRKAVVRKLYQDKILHEASCIHVNSEREARHIRELGFNSPIVVIPAGFNFGEFDALGKASSLNPPTWAEDIKDRRVLLYLARIHRAKGIEDLVSAWARVCRLHEDWVLVVVGPGERQDVELVQTLIKNMGIQKNCLLVGPVSDIHRAWAYLRCEVYVLPSHKENFGNTVQEALGYGRPVLTTAATPWTRLEEWGCGWTCSDDSDALTRALSTCLSFENTVLRDKGRIGRKVIQDKFSLESVVDEQIESYLWLSGQRKEPPDSLWLQ